MARDSAESRDGRHAGAVERRRGGLRALGATVPGLTRRVLGTRSLAEAALISEWADIVGAEWAAVCQPKAVRFPERGRRAEGTLVLRVQPGEATRLQHEEPRLLERVNGFFGYRAVARLRLEQAPLGRQREAEQAASGRSGPPLDPAAAAAAAEQVAGVGDADVREALQRLGRALTGDPEPVTRAGRSPVDGDDGGA